MALKDLTLAQIEERLDLLENTIAQETDHTKLPILNALIQKLIDEQARRDSETVDTD